MKILVTGANGQLGSEFQALAGESVHDFRFCDVDEMDLSKESSILSFLSGKKFDVIINCGAYTNVDGAEDNESLAAAINADAPGILAKYCANTNTRLIHISTDYVFDGQGNVPLSEEMSPNPISAYGRSKLEGEKKVFEILDNAYIIRTSWVYSSYGNNFLKTMLHLGKERKSLNVVYDQIGTPTYAADLALSVINIIDQWKHNDQPGLYHFSNNGVTSWYDFAKAIFDLSDLGCEVNPIRSSAFPTKAVRPAFSLLAKEKISQTFDLTIPYWKYSLAKCITLLESQYLNNEA